MKNLIFRAWDIEEQKMYDVEFIHPYEEPDKNGMEWEVLYRWYSFSKYYGAMSEDAEVDLEQCKVMQWTWWYDKNGKKVFPWDILAWHFNNWYSEKWCDTLRLVWYSMNRVSEFRTMELKPHKSADYSRMMCDTNNEEIVWNIYQNPELCN